MESLSYQSYDIIDEDIQRVESELASCSPEEETERYSTLLNYKRILELSKRVYNKMEEILPRTAYIMC